MNTLPEGRALTQCEHESWNRSNYPGTRQICAQCDEPTGRCEEDSLLNDAGETVCEGCYQNVDNGN